MAGDPACAPPAPVDRQPCPALAAALYAALGQPSAGAGSRCSTKAASVLAPVGSALPHISGSQSPPLVVGTEKKEDTEILGSGFIKIKLGYEEVERLAVGDYITFNNFSAGGHMWRVECYLDGGDKDGNNEYLSLYLEPVSKTKKVRAIFDAFFLGRDGKLCSPTDKRLETFERVGPACGWAQFMKMNCGWDQFMKRSDLELLYVMNGAVTIVCGVVVMNDSTLPVLPPSNLPSHLSDLLDCTLGTDVSFIVGGETFHAHRAVLAARSPVFKAELFGPMADATMPSITLQDIHPAAFKIMLRFVYTDALPTDVELGDSPVEMLQHLLAAADRFALDRLKVLCELKLWDNTSVMTAASVLACAETYNCPKLKTKCMDFFAVQENFYEAVFTDGFAMLLHKFPALAAELRKRVGKGHI